MSAEFRSSNASRDRFLLSKLLDNVTGLGGERLDGIWRDHLSSGDSLETLLLESELIDDSLLAHLYSEHFLLPLFDPPEGDQPPIDLKIASLLDVDFCVERMIAPLADDGTTIDVAIVSPQAFRCRDEVRHKTGRQMRLLFAPLGVVRRVLEVLYPRADGPRTLGSGLTRGGLPSGGLPSGGLTTRNVPTRNVPGMGLASTVLSSTGATEPVQFDPPDEPAEQREAKGFIHALFERALDKHASEIHVEPCRGSCRVRLRIQGSLVQVAPPGPLLVAEVLAYLRRLARIDQTRAGLPQEGSIRLRHGRRRISMPVHVFPTTEGDKFVLRILSRQTSPPRLQDIGLDASQLPQVTRALQGGRGLVLVVGPPHSGKRWTMYGCLNWLNTSERNLYSVEDTVALPLSGVNQVQTRPRAGLSTSEAVRGLMRQHPDAIMVSDIGDAEAARACVDAAAEGTLVLAAVTADSVVEAVQRLIQLGLRAAELDQFFELVINQRRLRRLCSACRAEDQSTEGTPGPPPIAARAGATATATIPLTRNTYGPVGCPRCRGYGYRGQLFVFDTVHSESGVSWSRLSRDETLGSESLIGDSLEGGSLEQKLHDQVAAGLTSAAEVARVLRS